MSKKDENKEKNFLGKDAILGAMDMVVEDVDVPEWGGTVKVSSMTGAQRDEFEGSCIIDKGQKKTPERNLKNMRARLLSCAIINAKGKRMFSMAEASQLGDKSAKALDRVYAVACRLNGIGAKDAEELTKN